MSKKETGVMVMKNGKAWGTPYADGYITECGWMLPEDAPIHNPKFCKNPIDVTYSNSPYIKELKTGKLINVERTTTVKILET